MRPRIIPLQSVHVGSPASSDSYWQFDILFGRRVGTISNAVSSDAVDELELHVARCCCECDSIAAVGSIGEVKD
jgi:hypothetical protein